MKRAILEEIRKYLAGVQDRVDDYATRSRQVNAPKFADLLDDLQETIEDLINENDDELARAA